MSDSNYFFFKSAKTKYWQYVLRNTYGIGKNQLKSKLLNVKLESCQKFFLMLCKIMWQKQSFMKYSREIVKFHLSANNHDLGLGRASS